LFSGEHARALDALRRALQLDPNLPLAHGYTGIVHAFSGNYDAAMAHLDEAVRLSPRDAYLVLWNIGRAWASLSAGRYEDLERYAQDALECNGEFADGYVLLAVAAGHLGAANTAVRALGGLEE